MPDDKMPRKMGRPPAFTSAKEMEDLAQEYFDIWEEKKRPITVVGLAIYLGVCKDTLVEYGKGTYDETDPEFSVTVKRAKDYIENHKWEKALTGQYHHSVAIFDLKNNHGATDRFEHLGKDGKELQSNTSIILIDSIDAAKAAEIYNELLKDTE